MYTGPKSRSTRRRGRRAAVAAAAAGLVLVPVAPALAHGEGDAEQSRVLVLDALTALANRPTGYEEMVSDKIGDALEAPDQAGVVLADVDSAQRALQSGDLATTRDLLQQSVQPVDLPVTGMETGTTMMLDPLTPSPSLTGLDGVLAALSAAAVVGGVVLVVRGRPKESLRDLRSGMTGGEPS